MYFLNAQKLQKNSRMVRGRRSTPADGVGELNLPLPDDTASTVWDTIRNTINHPRRTLYFIVDEAHRGAKQTSDRKTILQSLIAGHDDVPAMPIVWGISATVDRFNDLMNSLSATVGRMQLAGRPRTRGTTPAATGPSGRRTTRRPRSPRRR